MSIESRYADAYLLAKTTNGIGQTVKFVGLLVAALTALSGFVVASKAGGAFALVGVFLGALVALPFFALGVIIAAQGQLLSATLDTAVNTSPLLSQEQRQQLLLSSPQPAVQAGSTPIVSGDRQQCPRCSRWVSVDARVCDCGAPLNA